MVSMVNFSRKHDRVSDYDYEFTKLMARFYDKMYCSTSLESLTKQYSRSNPQGTPTYNVGSSRMKTSNLTLRLSQPHSNVDGWLDVSDFCENILNHTSG
jgi:hypothetical protein